MKTEVYSWRVSSELKSDLVREARKRKVALSSVLEEAAQAWLQRNVAMESDEDQQRRLRAEVEKHVGTVSIGRGPYTRQNIREVMVQRVAKRNVRRPA